MASKRQAPEDGPDGGRSFHQRGPKRQRPNTGSKSFKKTHPVNELKSQIRGLRRLLEHNENLPAKIRIEKERALQAAQHDLARAQHGKRRTEMIERYHKIRFFDRQKATRRLKKARKELRVCDDDSDAQKRAALAQRVDDAEVDLSYALYCPLDQPYVSLFPTHKKREGKDGEAGEKGESPEPAAEREGDAEMWKLVKQCMADNTLTLLREGKLQDQNKSKGAEKDEASKAESEPRREAARKGVASKQKKVEDEGDAESSDGSGGGFFE